MERTLPRPLVIPWRKVAVYVALFVVALPNFYAVFVTINGMLAGSTEADWWIISEASRRIDGGMYDRDLGGFYNYPYSPLLAYAFVVIAPLGPVVWRFAAAASLLLIPRKLALVAVLSWPFWWDLYAANVMAFAFVAGALALRGNRWGSYGFLLLASLIPRPLFVPMVVWILWRQPDTRKPAAIGAAVTVVLLLVSGWGVPWMQALVGFGDEVAGASNFATSAFNFGPSAFIGAWWLLIGVPLAAWLTWKGRLGYASLAASPYWIPYFLLVLLWELVPKSSHSGERLGAVPDTQEVHRGG